MKFRFQFIFGVTAILVTSLLYPASDAVCAQDAKLVLDSVADGGGLLVHVGTTDGQFEVSVARSGNWLVHGLTADNAALQTARENIRAAKLYGLASVEQVPTFAKLPYANDLVNVVVADLTSSVGPSLRQAEIERVLAPAGVAWLKRDTGEWTKTVKPVPPDVDTWPHWDRGADGNPSSQDRRIAPTTALRWLAGATNTDGAGSKVGLRLADGNVYYTGVNYDVDYRLFRERRSDVFARDAFNGILRWKRAIDGVPGHGDQPPRFALTTLNGRVYCYPNDGGPLHALDAATGETLVTFDDGPMSPPVVGWDKWRDRVRKVHFIVRVIDGKVVQTFGDGIYVSDAKSGKLLWRRSVGENSVVGWAVAGGDKIFAAVADIPLIKNRASHATPTSRILALDCETGEPRWQYNELSGRAAFRMIYFHDSLIIPAFRMSEQKANFGKEPLVVRLRADDGSVVWKSEPRAGTRGHYPIVMARGDEIFVGQQGGFGLDFATGAMTRSYNWGQIDASCADLKCVPNYTLYGLAFLDGDGNRITRGQTRTICDVGLFPGYGLLYGSPLGCLCSEYVNGYLALSAESLDEPVRDAERLARGPAFGKVVANPLWNRDAVEWPMHMADPRRSCWSPAPVADELQILWSTKLAERPPGMIATDWHENEKIVGPLTAPTAAAGKVFVAAPDEHRLGALDAASGKVIWSFTTAARVDSPPTIVGTGDDALCIFGCRDGYVYCTRASDGDLVWKFLAARGVKHICVQSQLESAWPAFGSVMPDGDGVIVSAGRQSALDGGIQIYKLAPADGTIIWHTKIWTDPDAILETDDGDLIRSRTRNRRVNDLLVHNGQQACLWITPLKDRYAADELVNIESSVIAARALKFSVPSKDDLREVSEATWLWAASSAGLLSRRMDSVGRHDNNGLNYADLNARKICLAGHSPGSSSRTLYALQAAAGKSKTLRGGLIRVTLRGDGSLPEKPDWSARAPSHGANDAMIVAGDRIYVTRFNPRDDGSRLLIYSVETGEQLAEQSLPARATRDGLIAAGGRVFLTCADGTVYCLGAASDDEGNASR